MLVPHMTFHIIIELYHHLSLFNKHNTIAFIRYQFIHLFYLTSGLFNQFLQLFFCTLICVAAPIHLIFIVEKPIGYTKKFPSSKLVYPVILNQNIIWIVIFIPLQELFLFYFSIINR